MPIYCFLKHLSLLRNTPRGLWHMGWYTKLQVHVRTTTSLVFWFYRLHPLWITFCFPDEHVYWNDIYIQINVYIVGFKNIYDTLKKYCVYRPGTTEAISGAASEPTFTGLETAEAALCNEIIHDAEPWAKTRLRVQESCLRETKQAASRHLWEEFQAHSCVHWSILPLK